MENLAQLIQTAANERGSDFIAYPERDGGEWYLIAGHRDSWLGATRVADTPYFGTVHRERARAALLFLMGHGDGFSIVSDNRALCVELADAEGNVTTVWRREAHAAFPDFFELHGLEKPRERGCPGKQKMQVG